MASKKTPRATTTTPATTTILPPTRYSATTTSIAYYLLLTTQADRLPDPEMPKCETFAKVDLAMCTKPNTFAFSTSRPA